MWRMVDSGRAGRQAGRQAGIQTGRQAGRQRQADRTRIFDQGASRPTYSDSTCTCILCSICCAIVYHRVLSRPISHFHSHGYNQLQNE